MGTLNDDTYSILLDSDIVCLKEFSNEFYSIVEDRLPMVYNLPRYGGVNKLVDVNKICPDIKWLSWAGGEFIGGTPEFFAKLYHEIVLFKNNYWSSLQTYNLFHVGDEMLTTIALAKLRKKGVSSIDAGVLGFIYRYWSIFEYKDINDIGVPLIHLPGDKNFLFDIRNFSSMQELQRKYKKRHLLCIVKGIVKKILKK